MTTPPTAAPGRFLLALGLLLPILGIIGYAAQVVAWRLTPPWIVPATATLGVLCIIAALWQARTVWRWLALAPVLLVASLGWAFLAVTRLPEYTGPVAVGQPFPAFTTALADGSSFTQRDLAGDRASVLVFFRGRW